MPAAKPHSLPKPPALLSSDEIIFIKNTIERFFGDDAIVRNYGSDPDCMALHVEAGSDIGMEKYDCLGVLMTKIDRDQIHLEVTRRGTRVRGDAKLAYRQGIVL